MATWDAVVAYAKTLPGVEETAWDGTPELSVHGKGFVRHLPGGNTLVIMCTPGEKSVLLSSGDPALFTTHDYDGLGAILAHLDDYDEVTDLEELISEAWRITIARTGHDE